MTLPHTRLHELLLLALLAGTLVDCKCTPKPNVLLVTVDTLRADHLGTYGYTASTSPTIDRLAREGITFERAYCQIPKTNPSLASLMTGLYPQSHHILELMIPLPEGHETMAERFEAAGYQTAAVIGQYNLVRELGFSQGFGTYVDDFPGERPEEGEAQGRFTPWAEKRAAEIVDDGLGWLEGRDRRPFFLWLHFMDPHAAYDAPPPYDQALQDVAYDERSLPRKDIFDKVYVPERLDRGFYVRKYDQEVAYLDQQIGRLLAALERKQLLDSTLIVFTADHGEYMGDEDIPEDFQPMRGPGNVRPPQFNHGATLSEGEVRVPLIIKPAQGLAGGLQPGRTGEVVELVDVLPSLLELLDLPAGDEPLDGSSFADLMQDPSATRDDVALLYAHETNSVGVRSRSWKLVAFPRSPIADYFVGKANLETLSGGFLFLHNEASMQEGANLVETEARARERLIRVLFGRLGAVQERRRDRMVIPAVKRNQDALRERLESLGYF